MKERNESIQPKMMIWRGKIKGRALQFSKYHRYRPQLYRETHKTVLSREGGNSKHLKRLVSDLLRNGKKTFYSHFCRLIRLDNRVKNLNHAAKASSNGLQCRKLPLPKELWHSRRCGPDRRRYLLRIIRRAFAERGRLTGWGGHPGFPV
jgi:hypothetical protein